MAGGTDSTHKMGCKRDEMRREAARHLNDSGPTCSKSLDSMKNLVGLVFWDILSIWRHFIKYKK